MRRLRPEFWKAMDTMNMANTKNTVGVAKLLIILGSAVTWKIAGSTVKSMAAKAMGRASVTQKSTAASIKMMEY